jgi:tetratricopeptide (TPR) repeat protein
MEFFGSYLNPESSVEILSRWLKIMPSGGDLWNELSLCYATLNKKRDALYAANRFMDLSPAEPNAYDTKGDMYAWFLEYDSSRICYQEAVALRRDFASAFKLGCWALLRQDPHEAEKYFDVSGPQELLIDAYGGKLGSVERTLTQSTDFQIPQTGGMSRAKLMTMINFSYEMGQFTEMLRLSRQLALESTNDHSGIIHGREYLAWALTKNGKSADAESVLDELGKDVHSMTPAQHASVDYAFALVALEEGKDALAYEKFRKCVGELPPNHEPFIFWAIALLKSGRIPEAISELQRLKSWLRDEFHYF